MVDDGSKDETAAKADEWEARYPGIIRAVHQENGGHGIAVLSACARRRAPTTRLSTRTTGSTVRRFRPCCRFCVALGARPARRPVYLELRVREGLRGHAYRYWLQVCPAAQKDFLWDQIGHFRPDQNLLMHSLCYRTDVLRESNLPMPAHTFYVDNIYAYVPLPRCKTMYYADIDLYRYFIGREGQSVNEATMVKRLGQQFRVTRIMMESFHLYQDVESSRLRSYMMGYFTMMMAICSVLTKLSEEDCADERLKTLWKDLKEYDERMYRRARYGVVGFFTNLRGRAGDKTTLGLYHLAQRSSNSTNC
ncbi:MAG: glycosyltransferase [Collinsella sp.]